MISKSGKEFLPNNENLSKWTNALFIKYENIEYKKSYMYSVLV